MKRVEKIPLEELKEILFKKNPGYRKIMVADATWYSYFSKHKILTERIIEDEIRKTKDTG